MPAILLWSLPLCLPVGTEIFWTCTLKPLTLYLRSLKGSEWEYYFLEAAFSSPHPSKPDYSCHCLFQVGEWHARALKKTCKEMCFKGAGLFFRPSSVHRLFPCFSFSFCVSWLPEEWLSVWYIWCCHLLCSSPLLWVYFLLSSPLPLLFSPVKVRHNTNQCLLFLWLGDRAQWVWEWGQFQSFCYTGTGRLWSWGWWWGVKGACLQALFAQLTVPTESPEECPRSCCRQGRCFLLTQSAFSFAHWKA